MAEPTYEELGRKLKAAIRRADAAEQKAEGAVKQARTAEGHIQAIFSKLQAGNLLLCTHADPNSRAWTIILTLDLVLPRAPVQFILKDMPDRAQVFAKQVRSFEQERGNLVWANNRRKCLGNLVIQSPLPPDGVSLAVTQAIIWASRGLRSHYDGSSVKRLVELDHILLVALCTVVDWELDGRVYNLQLHIRPLLQATPEILPDFKRHLQRHMRELGYPREINGMRQSLSEGAALLFLKKIWFPQTLKFLRSVRMRRVTDFLVPRNAGRKLPVELMDTIAGSYYGADVIARASSIAKPTVRKYRSRGCDFPTG